MLYFGAVNQLILILGLFLLILYSGSDLVVASSIPFRIVACESQLGGRGVNLSAYLEMVLLVAKEAHGLWTTYMPEVSGLVRLIHD